MFKLVDDYKQVLANSYSAYCLYIIFAILTLPALLFIEFEIEFDPYATMHFAILVCVCGIIGRVVKQGQNKPWKFLVAIAVSCYAIFYFNSVANAHSLESGWRNAIHQTVSHRGEPKTAPDLEPKNAVYITQHDPNGFDEIAFKLIARWEGKRNTAYHDVVNVPTICYGHTRTVTNADVRNGLTKSDDFCKKLLIEEIHEYRDEAMSLLKPNIVREHMIPTRKAAVTSLTFNIGWGGFGRSSARKAFNAGDIKDGCRRMTFYNRAGNKIYMGLVNRRKAEHELCVVGL